MNTITSKILAAIFAAFLLTMISSVVYHILNKKYETETAILAQATDSVSFNGVYIRNETPVTYSGNGVVSYCVSDGGKLGKNSVIAEIYSDEAAIENKNNIEELQNELSILERIQNPGTQNSAQPAFLSGLIDENYKSIIYDIDTNNIGGISSERDEFLIHLSTMQLITGETTSFKDQISQIKTKISELTASQAAPIDQISSENSKYFISYVDGYESTFTPETMNTLTAEDLLSVKDDIQPGGSNGVIGKVINGYQWYIAGVVDNSKNKFNESEYITLKFESTSETVNALVKSVRNTDNPKQSIIILSCDVLTYDLVQHRTERVKMIKGTYEGIKIPRKAIRFKNIEETITDDKTGEQYTKTTNYRGVYIKLGEQILFKKVDVVYEGDDYVISTVNLGGEYVELYDDIIVEGVDSDGN